MPEDLLEQSGQAFEALLTSSNVAIAAVDPAGKVVLWNRGAERILGWSEQDVMGEFLPAIFPGDRERFAAFRQRILDGDTLDGLRWRHRRKGGQGVDLVLSLRPIRDQFGVERAVLCVASQADAAGEVRRMAERIEGLEARLAETQLPPHFLFNALQAVSVLLKKGEIGPAGEVLSRLSALLQRVLYTRGKVRLETEMELVDDYVRVQGVRFGDRVATTYRVDPGVEDALVPHMVLQPLVENVFRHAFPSRQSEDRLVVEARRDDDALCIRVSDNGRGLPEGGRPSDADGLGLRSTRRRLGRQYGDAWDLILKNREGPGTTVLLRLPYEPDPEAG